MTILLLAALAAGAAAAPDPRIIPLPLNPIIPAAQRTCAVKTATGLGYTELRTAPGPKPVAGDIVLINYIGYLATSGATFDQAMTSALPVDGVIPGFAEGLKLVPKGGIYRLCVPAGLGYGPEATGSIPANSDLVFQVELVDRKTAAEVRAMQAEAQAAQGGKPAQ